MYFAKIKYIYISVHPSIGELSFVNYEKARDLLEWFQQFHDNYWFYYTKTNEIPGELSRKKHTSTGEQDHRYYGYIITGAFCSESELG